MKAKMMVFLFCSTLFTSALSIACGGGGCDVGGGRSYSSCDESWNQYSYYQTNSDPACDCNCTDNGWRYNDCISKCEYCDAFGNIGAR